MLATPTWAAARTVAKAVAGASMSTRMTASTVTAPATKTTANAELTGGSYSPSPGVIYPTLTWLEELGHVSIAVSEGTKKLHAITAEGRAHLDVYRPTLDALLARLRPTGASRCTASSSAAPRTAST